MVSIRIITQQIKQIFNKFENNKKDSYIYILKLINDKYYVGKSIDPISRISSHFHMKGAKWTQIHKPVKIINLFLMKDEFDEDVHTLKMMKQYGVPNVRGGSFSQINLDKNQVSVVEKMIHTSSNTCYNCGSIDHFMNDCKIKKIDL